MKIKNLIKYLFFIAFVIFCFLGLSSVISRIMLGIILLIAIPCIGKSFNYLYRPVINVIIIFFLLIALNFVYYLISPKIVIGTLDWGTTGFFANIGMNLGVFFIAYYYSVNDSLKDSEIKMFFILLFAVTLVRFLVTRDTILIDHNGNLRTMNMAYDFVIFIPFLVLFHNKSVPIIFLLLSIYCVMYGGKRGAILIFVLSAAILLYNKYLRYSRKHFVRNLVIILTFSCICVAMTKDIFQQSTLLQSRLEQTISGDSNGRDEIFRAIWNAWANSNVLHIIFGFGFCSSVQISGNYAHNDWLELLSMAGLLGVMIYCAFFIQIFLYTRGRVHCERDRQILYLILFIWFLKSLFSMAYCSVGSMPMTFLCGYIVGKNARNKKPIIQCLN